MIVQVTLPSSAVLGIPLVSTKKSVGDSTKTPERK